MSRAPASPERRSPWIYAIVIGLTLMVLVNITFIIIAVRGADDVVPSYLTEHR